MSKFIVTAHFGKGKLEDSDTQVLVTYNTQYSGGVASKVAARLAELNLDYCYMFTIQEDSEDTTIWASNAASGGFVALALVDTDGDGSVLYRAVVDTDVFPDGVPFDGETDLFCKTVCNAVKECD